MTGRGMGRHRVGLLSPLLLMGCSTAASPAPTSPLVLQGAVVFQVGPGPVDGGASGECGIPPTSVTLRSHDAGPRLPLEIEDASVGDFTCDVQSTDGGPSSMQAALGVGSSERFAVSGNITPAASAWKATFQIAGVTYAPTAPCSLDVSEYDGMGLSTNGAWAIVTCPVVSDGEGHNCSAGAEFAFEGCAP